MVQMDWDRIRGVKAVSLTDDEIEDLFPMVIGCDTEQVDNIHNLRALIKLSQEMLQYKDNQVESLVLECDELKTKISNNLTPKKSKKNNVIDNGVTQISDLNSNNYEEILRTKNEKIKTLMNELKEFEKENEELKEKLGNLKEEMEDAIESMNEMTEELNNQNGKLLLLKEEASNLKQEKAALFNQIEEMTAAQLERDKVIDEFGAAIDERVSEWKGILDSKDAEIFKLKEQLSQSLISPSTSRNVTAEIVYLNEEIDKRDKIIEELKFKLGEAAAEINDSAAVIEKLNGDLKKMEKSGKRKEQRDLLKKIQDANEKISILNSSLAESENNLMAKSQQLCEVLDSLKKYQNKNQGLTETINEVKELKKQLTAKTNHIQDLVNVVNKLEALNSRQEIQIIALREKLGMSDDEEICVEAVESRYQEEARVKNELLKHAEMLEQENLDFKSDIRALKYKLSKFSDKPIISSRDSPDKKQNQDNSSTINWTDEGFISLRRKSEYDEVQKNMKIIVEENEALRKGMHEILDSIHDQDGKSSIEIQSDILERLLETLDVRHLAGWYHPAMRLQERLNVIQGSNNELRSQLKQLRKEIQKKDNILKKVALKHDYQNSVTNSEESETEEAKVYALEMEKIQTRYENDFDEWLKEKETLTQKISDLTELKEKLETQLKIYENDLKVFGSSEDEINQAFAIRTKEFTELMTSQKITSRKIKLLESLLNDELQKMYFFKKETIASESAYKKTIADLEKGAKLLEQKVTKLEKNFVNTVSRDDFDELNKKYNQLHLRYRVLYEVQLSVNEKDFKGVEKINAELQEQLASVQTLLAEKIKSNCECESKIGDKNPFEMKEEILKLRNENNNLMKSLEISRDEAQKHYLTNSLKIFEVDNLRHQIVDLQAVSEDKETIARLGFELNTCKAVEMETNIYKAQLENEVARAKKDFEVSEEKYSEIQSRLEEHRNYCDKKSRNYELIIDFLRNQYSGSTSATSLLRYEDLVADLKRNRAEVERQLKEAKETLEKARMQQETLTNRLEIVERLKDILEQQIGSANVEDVIKTFSDNSQSTLNEYRYKRKICQLENELQVQINKLSEYEGIIVEMEIEMVSNQKAWKNFDNLGIKSPRKNLEKLTEKKSEEFPVKSLVEKSQTEKNEKVMEKKSISTQIDVCTRVIGIQTDLNFNKESKKEVELNKTANAEEKVPEFLENQLKEALTLASDRSAKLIRYESQITEYQAKINALNRSLEDKDSELIEQKRVIARKSSENIESEEATEKVTLKSTTNSLQKIISQKEETILRYQNLLKEERDEYNKATARLQEQINKLNLQIDGMKNEQDKMDQSDLINELKDTKPKFDIDSEDKIVRLTEQVSNLQADLEIASQLNERWRRLAEERLEHVDEIRSKLELQHKNELDSYRREIDKWQLETSALRQQLSDNRIKLTKGNITLTKELQERDNKIEELTVAYQQLQSEFEMIEFVHHQTPSSQQSNKFNNDSNVNHSYDRTELNRTGENPQSQGHSELDLLKKQHKSFAEKEKMYKEQIIDLKQQLSRRYMAEKSEERKTSMREAQLEKKLKSMEEELNKARVQLDREYRFQENKRIKTAEELSLWEKQKKWQGLSEKLKRELKDKEAEIKKLNVNYEKLRSIVSCMEREKWFLRSKIKAEDCGTARPDFNLRVIEDLQRECQTLRDRIKELTDRLETEDCQRLGGLLEQQKRRIAALEIAAEGNLSVVDQLEALEAAKSALEKKNIKLESENFELHMEIEKVSNDTPRLKEKVEHLEKYVQLLKIEKSPDSSACSSEKDHEQSSKKSALELERTIFVLKRIVEKLQAENKRLRVNSKNSNRVVNNRGVAKTVFKGDGNGNGKRKDEEMAVLKRQYEEAKKRVIALETDLQLAEQRIKMLEDMHKEDTSVEINILKQQLAHKSELLDKVKQLLTRAAINEKALRQRIHQIEMKQTLSTIPECQLPSPTQN
ncbi:Similar to cep290: Centrosomal protein cep290 (Drosophila melanogaster) [Cotesia congregata]|uniref:Similar to cep290: Centrosomal protein cep290 (Drosophila melanogaster) n=1 Tax=Cotesia congregata TaxID=51543 RepID=A0A8J2EIN6_COTCN|nr:Similar to cep290: Centrosomal protein cep290 (Drosophila melanogaster) [Cotesia congregata]